MSTTDAEAGCSLPLEYMLAVMKDETASQERRDEMAKLAAPYLHAKAEAKARDAKRRSAKPTMNETDGGETRDADPIIRTARATLKRKLGRLAPKGTDTQTD